MEFTTGQQIYFPGGCQHLLLSKFSFYGPLFTWTDNAPARVLLSVLLYSLYYLYYVYSIKSFMVLSAFTPFVSTAQCSFLSVMCVCFIMFLFLYTCFCFSFLNSLNVSINSTVGVVHCLKLHVTNYFTNQWSVQLKAQSIFETNYHCVSYFFFYYYCFVCISQIHGTANTLLYGWIKILCIVVTIVRHRT